MKRKYCCVLEKKLTQMDLALLLAASVCHRKIAVTTLAAKKQFQLRMGKLFLKSNRISLNLSQDAEGFHRGFYV